MSKCEGIMCDFEWDLNITPIVENIDSNGSNIYIISGSGFDLNIENNIVKFDDMLCSVIEASETTLKVSAKNLSNWYYRVSVFVVEKGNALIQTYPYVTIQSTTTSSDSSYYTIGSTSGL